MRLKMRKMLSISSVIRVPYVTASCCILVDVLDCEMLTCVWMYDKRSSEVTWSTRNALLNHQVVMKCKRAHARWILYFLGLTLRHRISSTLRFEGPQCVRIHFSIKSLWPWRRRQYMSPKRRKRCSPLHNFTSGKTWVFSNTAVRTSKSRKFSDLVTYFEQKYFWRHFLRVLKPACVYNNLYRAYPFSCLNCFVAWHC